MGVPDNPEAFIQFEADGLTVYIAQHLLESLEPGARQMPFYIDGYGQYMIVFEAPWGGET